MMTKSKASGNYVNSVLAKTEVKKAGYDEAIMLDPEGYVSEASGEHLHRPRSKAKNDTAYVDPPGDHPGFDSGRRSRQRLRSGRRALYS
jgi:branched-chain amino acid aminotransferase